jgi:hypothetical protein
MKYESDVLRGDRKLTLTHRTLIKFMARLNFTSRRRMTTQMSTSVTEVQSRQLMKAFLSLSCSSCCDRFQSFVVLTEIVLLSSPPALPQRMHPSRLAQGTHHCVKSVQEKADLLIYGAASSQVPKASEFASSEFGEQFADVKINVPEGVIDIGAFSEGVR